MSAPTPPNVPHAVSTGSPRPTIGDLVIEATTQLSRVEDPAIEARDLVAAVLDAPRFWPTLNARERATDEQIARVRAAIARRAAGAPQQYAAGRAAFRFLTIDIDERALIPRPETEQLVELVLATPQAQRGGVAADIGTGSGAIALSLSAEGRFSRVLATDLSRDALDLARHNARLLAPSLRAPIEFLSGDALAPVGASQCDVIVSNPPYITFGELEHLPAEVRDWEPSQALCCADDGLQVTRAIVEGAPSVLAPDGLLALEVDYRRAERVAALARATGAYAQVSVRPDYSGRDRFVVCFRGPIG